MQSPRWILTEDLAVDIDQLNWKLYRRVMDKKTRLPKGWKVDSYYPRLRNLMVGIMDMLMLTDTDSDNIPEHVEKALEACQVASDALQKHMQALGVGLDTLPPKYAKL